MHGQDLQPYLCSLHCSRHFYVCEFAIANCEMHQLPIQMFAYYYLEIKF